MRGCILSEKVQRLKPETVVFPAWKEGLDFGEIDVPFEMLEILEIVFGERG